ncbi:Hypothetical_protein [Hexamita inflata]|uniref:Hypothetical_protein n=1 Tax=Hexamita inflata TaxID=28002 RepID=A0AA86P6J3_9EUKA|nr:Hypothetical protein HINF_LOCUS19433 [Hexamita inflata]
MIDSAVGMHTVAQLFDTNSVLCTLSLTYDDSVCFLSYLEMLYNIYLLQVIESAEIQQKMRNILVFYYFTYSLCQLPIQVFSAILSTPDSCQILQVQITNRDQKLSATILTRVALPKQ